MHLCTQSLSINICWLERNQGYDKELYTMKGSSCYSNESLTPSELIAEHEARQLIVVQDSQILGWHIFVCLCVMLRNARSTSFSTQA